MAEHETYPDLVNLENCEREPIHIIGKIQEHGVLVACDKANLEITQVSRNAADFFGINLKELLGKPMSSLLGDRQVQHLRESLKSEEEHEPQEILVKGKKYILLSHISNDSLVLDFEPVNEVQDPFFFQKKLNTILNRFQKARSFEELTREAAVVTRQMFGYDRVMVYKFDEEWNGVVIAECKDKNLEPWLGLHYPATDIPEQSRKLFLKHRVRIITNVHYKPVPIEPEFSPLNGEALDISLSGLRAVSPIHIEYLKNMGVAASLSAAIVVKGKLWGLIACHHNGKKYLDLYQRETCRFLAQMFSNEITLHETSNLLSKSELTENIRRQLMAQMKYHQDILAALNRDTVKFTDLIECTGGAIYYIDRWELNGRTPTPEQLDSLLENFIRKQSKSLFLTRNLSALFPEAEAYCAEASGLLSLRVADNKYILWFRPEVPQVINWGGNPNLKAYYNKKEDRISPRRSFQKWTEKLTGFAEPWHQIDKNNARSLRENMSYILLHLQRKEIEALNEKLLAAHKELELFSYGLSHDLRAPVRGMEGFIKILQEDYGQLLGEKGNRMLEMSNGLIEKMNTLIDDILEYFRLGHSDEITRTPVDTASVLKEVVELFNIPINFPKTSFKIQQDLPVVEGDQRMIFQLWSNLLNNALKYSSEEEKPIVEIGWENVKGRKTFFIKDNGIGVEPQFKERIFETFKRAAGSRFKGTGVGLAIVKRIVEKHKGKVWLESKPGNGSVFYFYLEGPNED
ncbi:ATP-binding protein [Salinimicrobium sp. HB62]|uniref:ATP-binding protein n=1 Tax=Salinimicrobium sp. HB62 TaxID=3077781 RepID=UPI002D7652B8|nr:ATP-binding protein [Salinimicrobium sp. HB62]